MTMLLFLLFLIAIAVVFGRGVARGVIVAILGLILALYLLGTIIIATGG